MGPLAFQPLSAAEKKCVVLLTGEGGLFWCSPRKILGISWNYCIQPPCFTLMSKAAALIKVLPIPQKYLDPHCFEV